MRPRLAVALLASTILMTILVAASPAGANGKIPEGRYPCYTYTSSGAKDYTGFVLKIRSATKYAFMRPGKWVERGRYQHPSKGAKLYWTSGYLKMEAKGGHLWDPDFGMNVLEILWNEPKGGAEYYHCFQ